MLLPLQGDFVFFTVKHRALPYVMCSLPFLGAQDMTYKYFLSVHFTCRLPDSLICYTSRSSLSTRRTSSMLRSKGPLCSSLSVHMAAANLPDSSKPMSWARHHR